MLNLYFDKVNDLPYIYIQNFYSEEDLNRILKELLFLQDIDRYKEPTHPDGPGTAMKDGKSLKRGKGLHLDVVYNERESSDILRINRKLFAKETTEQLEYHHPLFRYVKRSNRDNTKIHYFSDGDYYSSHVDDCVITAISWFYETPKQFTGGDLILEHQIEIPCLNNSMVIFPSIMWHEVTPVSGTGRYSMSQFLEM